MASDWIDRVLELTEERKGTDFGGGRQVRIGDVVATAGLDVLVSQVRNNIETGEREVCGHVVWPLGGGVLTGWFAQTSCVVVTERYLRQGKRGEFPIFRGEVGHA